MIYDTYDLKMLADCLAKLIDSKDYRSSMVEEADKLVNRDFNIKMICKKLGDIYESM